MCSYIMCYSVCPFICVCLSSLFLSHWCFMWCPCSQQLETDLKIEREWRQTLQNDLDRERDIVAQLSTEALQIKRLKKVKRRNQNKRTRCMILYSMIYYIYVYITYNNSPLLCVGFYFLFQEFHRLQDENIQLKTICEDQEQALEELGSKLSEYVC